MKLASGPSTPIGPTGPTFQIGKAGSRNFHGIFRNFIGTFWELSEESDHFPYLATHNAGRSPHMPGTARRQESEHFPYLASLNAERSPTRSFDHRVTHGGHGKTAKAAEEALRAQNGLSAEAPLRPNPLSMHLGHAPRCGTVCPHTLVGSGIGGNAWGTAPRSKRRPNVGRF